MTTSQRPVSSPGNRSRSTTGTVADTGDHLGTDPPRAGSAPVVSVAELRNQGVHPSTITKRCRPGGPWTRLTTGVVLLGTERPNRRQSLRATAACLGPDCVLTGIDALHAHGVEQPWRTTIHALVPSHRRVLPPHFATVERTSRLPEPAWIDGLPFAPPVRATLDAARGETDEHRLRDLLSLPVQQGLCTFTELVHELGSGNQRGSAAVRAQLRLLASSTGGYVHGLARRLMRRCPVPPPRWGAVVHDPHGRRLGAVDAWWDDIGLGWQFTELRAERQPGDEKAAHRERLALTAAGVVVVRTSPRNLREHENLVLAELARAFHRAATRPRPQVRCELPGAHAGEPSSAVPGGAR